MIQRQLAGFVAGGCLGVLADAFAYRLLYEFMDPRIAKGFSFVFGSFFSYTVNHFYSFQGDNHQTQLPRFSVLYCTSLTLNTLINALLLNSGTQKPVAFVLATAGSTAMNFLGLKFFVFKKGSKS